MTDFSNINAEGILTYFLDTDTQLDPLIISSLWRQMRILVTKQSSQDEVRLFLEKDDNFIGVLNKMKQICDEKVFATENIDSFFFQFIANFITANPSNKTFLSDILITKDEELLPAVETLFGSSFNNPKLRKFMCTFLYNFIKDQKPDVILAKLFPSLTKSVCLSPPVWKCQFQFIIRGVLIEFIQGAENNSEESHLILKSEQEQQVTQWTLLFISLLFNANQANSISIWQYLEVLLVFKQVRLEEVEDGDTHKRLCIAKQLSGEYNLNDVIEDKHFEAFQLFLFHICQSFVDKKVVCSFVKGVEPRIIDVRCEYVNECEYKFQVSSLDVRHSIEQFRTVHSSLVNELNKKHAFSDCEPTVSEEEKIKYSQHLRDLHDKLRWWSIMTFLGGYNSELQTLVMKEGLLLEVLTLNQHLQRLNSLSMTEDKPMADVKLQALRYFEKDIYQDIFSTILRFLSNVVHINRPAQDFILNNDFLISCLSQTHMDPTNPLQREWSVMLIRNLCDSNDLMQETISNLKIQDFSDKSQQILHKYQAKKEELESLRQSLLQNQNIL